MRFVLFSNAVGPDCENGELLRAAADGFEVLVTGDQNLQFQQNLIGLSISVAVLVARSNKITDLVPLVPGLLDALKHIQPGELRRITDKPE